MTKNSKELSEETVRLKNENTALKHKLSKDLESIKAIKAGNIDALVIENKKDLKVYTEETADKLYRLLIEKMHEGAVTLNADGIILYCNSYFANLVKLPLQKAIGTVFENYIDENTKKHFEVLFNDDSINVLKEEVIIHASDGKEIPVLMTVNSLPLNNIFVLSIILTDLTIPHENQEKLKRRTMQLEQKNEELETANKELAFQIREKEKRGAELVTAKEDRAERASELVIAEEEKAERAAELSVAKTDVKELEGLNAHKESVLATLSHDLRSPLTGIIGLTELLKDNIETFDNVTVKEMLDLLFKSSTDELIMLDYLVEWARIKHASEAFSPEKIELNQYVKRIFNTLNENAVSKEIILQNEIKDNMKVFADGKMLLSILQNIVSNSIRHTNSGGKVTASAKRRGDKIIIEINDTGTGMSKEVREKLFTPQIKALLNARKENKGAGIGLLLVKNFLEKNGGEIWVESIEGEGSSFYFTLPAEIPDVKMRLQL